MAPLELSRVYGARDAKFYRAQVRVAKNRKALGRRVNLYVPVQMRAAVRRTANDLSRYLSSKDPEEKIFARCSASAINAALKKAGEKIGLPPTRIPTTYSFRSIFISEAIRFYKRK